MKQVGIILLPEYRLLSIAAILDVLEAVNKIQKENKVPEQYKVTMFSAAAADQPPSNSFHGYKIVSIHTDLKPELIFIPSFSTENIGSNQMQG